MQEGEHRERELQGQHDLAEGQEIGHAAIAAQTDDEDRGEDGQCAGDQPPHPGLNPPMHEPFHHHLPGERPGNGTTLAAGQERHGEQRACDARAQQRREGQVRDANPITVGSEMDHLSAHQGRAVPAEEHNRREYQDRRIDKKRDGQRDGRIDRVKPNGAPHGGVIFPQLAALHDSGIWNRRLRATALPSTSAKSQAPTATSHKSQLGQRVQRGYQSRQHCARSLPVTTPKRAAVTCMKIAIRLARPTTQSKPYLNCAPPCRSVPQLPGSMYPTLTRRAGPTNARQCSQKPAWWWGTSTVLCIPSSDRWPACRVAARSPGADPPPLTGTLLFAP